MNKAYESQVYLGDEKLYKKVNLLCLLILSYPHKGKRKNKNKDFNSNAQKFTRKKGNLLDLHASMNQ